MDYLDVKDQLELASSNVFMGEMFKRYASHRYKHMNESLTIRIGDTPYLQKLLQIVGENLVTYEQPLTFVQNIFHLEDHCRNVKNLKMGFDLNSIEWPHLLSFKKIKSLDTEIWSDHALQEDRDKLYTEFVNILKHLPCLKKLKLKAVEYNGGGLHYLEQLESLELDVHEDFDGKNLEYCCQTIKQLRHLDIAHTRNLTKNNFEILVTNWQQLERLAFSVQCFDSTMPYELVCQLPRLQHLQVVHDGSVRDSLIEGLINKKGSPLESLILGPDKLSVDQVKRLCNISTLKELEVACDTVPLADLLKLKNLLYLHISMPITNDHVLDLLKGLPLLKVLNIQVYDMINKDNLVDSVRTWVSEQKEQRGKIQIYFEFYMRDILYANHLVEIKIDCLDPILINKELSERV
ncbi:uncharacterized protein LOC121403770 [Drosophila obscura]|uniref:uncharacterized protein LOC121403770 n=1 Tax=Drosophila obscura TaxID=7282 RepID=UPI001BB2460E|nr:uncharacterized protein LOC121403770 [Drosophila obscura]